MADVRRLPGPIALVCPAPAYGIDREAPSGMTELLVRLDHGRHPPRCDGNATGDVAGPALLTWRTESWTTSGTTTTVLSLAGEIDLSSRPRLSVALDEARAAAPAHLVIDLAAVTFCDARGFQMLADATDGSGRRILVGLHPRLVRYYAPTGVGEGVTASWRALTESAGDERVGSIGVPDSTPERREKAVAASGVTAAVNQVELHPCF